MNNVLKRLETSDATAEVEKISELIKVKIYAYIVSIVFLTLVLVILGKHAT